MSAAHVSVALIIYLSSVVMVQTIAQRMLSTQQPYSSSLEIVRGGGGGGLVVCECVWGGGWLFVVNFLKHCYNIMGCFPFKE